MNYYSAWLLAEDQDWMNRCGMCAEDEGHGFDWGVEKRRTLASAPGFAAAYESALISGVPNPGRDQSVISDQQLLAALQAAAPTQGGGHRG